MDTYLTISSPSEALYKGQPRKVPLPPDVERDLIEENQQLRMEIEYIKKLSALVLANERARKNKQK